MRRNSYRMPLLILFLILLKVFHVTEVSAQQLEFSDKLKSSSAVDRLTGKPGVKVYRFYVDETNLKSYNNFLKGKAAVDVDDFTESYFERHLWELYVFQTAPILGGCQCQIEYLPYTQQSMHARSIMDVVSGRSMSNPIASNVDDPRIVHKDIELSEEILDGQDFYAGLYTHKDRADVLKLDNLDDIKKLRFAASGLWAFDVKLLNKLGVKTVLVDDWTSVIKMVMAKRADVLIQPFSSEKGMQRYDMATNSMFLPIRGVKVLFGQSRSYIVNVKLADGRGFLLALNKGIRQLRENGLLYKGAKAAGFYRNDIKDWLLLQ